MYMVLIRYTLKKTPLQVYGNTNTAHPIRFIKLNCFRFSSLSSKYHFRFYGTLMNCSFFTFNLLSVNFTYFESNNIILKRSCFT